MNKKNHKRTCGECKWWREFTYPDNLHDVGECTYFHGRGCPEWSAGEYPSLLGCSYTATRDRPADDCDCFKRQEKS